MANQQSAFQKYLSLLSNRLLETSIWTFAELGVADLLSEAKTPQTAEELAEKQGWNSEYLYRLLRLVADADIVREIKSEETIQNEKTHRFELTEDGLYLTSNHPSKIRHLLRWELSPLVKQASIHLPEVIRNKNANSCLQHVIGNTQPFEYLSKEENQHLAEVFNNAMSSLSIYSRNAVVNAVDFGRFNTIVDIGGGLGVLLSSILQKYPTIKQGICFDLPSVIEHAKVTNEIQKENISQDRYEFLGGDMFNSETIPQGDAYVMKSMIHDWTNEDAIRILESIRKATNERKITLFLVECVILTDDEKNSFFKQFPHANDLHMMIMTNAKERTQKQYEYLFDQSGFQLKKLYRTETPYSVIEAITV